MMKCQYYVSYEFMTNKLHKWSKRISELAAKMKQLRISFSKYQHIIGFLLKR